MSAAESSATVASGVALADPVPVPCASQLDRRPVEVVSPAAGSDRLLRVFDIVVTVALLPLALVVGSLIAVLIVLDSPGAVIFRQQRVGKDGELFTMLKFRKMRRNAKGGLLTIGDDHRFTPIGRLLALTKLDELPQLWNVLKGDMRLVGPRPEVPEFVEQYRDRYGPILSVRPGITGPAAVEYSSESHLLASKNDPLRFYEEQLMPRKIDIDIAYVRTRSLRGDLRILLATFCVPFSRLSRSASKSSSSAQPAAAFLGCSLALAIAFVVAGHA